MFDTAAPITFDGAAMTQTDSLRLDGTAVTTGFAVTAGAGSDSLTGGSGGDNFLGGAGSDTLLGGNGDDSLAGGLDADTLTGGAGNDRFFFELGTPRSGSSPTTIDTVTDFTTGDRLDLPGVNAINGYALVFNVTESAFNYTGGSSGLQPGANAGDGFVDVFWRNNAAAGRLEIWVDGNDDGQFSEQDLLIHLPTGGTGMTSITLADFVDNFIAYRGTAAGELMNGNASDNQVYALAGNDTVNGNDGNDLLLAAGGNDAVSGGLGADTVHGGSGSDTLHGNDGGDTLYAQGYDTNVNTPAVEDAVGAVNWLYGGNGGDALYGSTRNDFLFGEADNDYLAGGVGDDSLEGGDGNDNLNGDEGLDTLIAGIGDDSLNGGLGSDVLVAGSGNDWVYVGPGDTVDGGDGNDIFHFDDSQGGGGIATGGLGADTFQFASYGSIYYLAFSTVGNPSRITDFNAAEGDRIVTGITSGVAEFGSPVVWRGTANAAFTATVGQSLTLAGADTSDNRFLGLWTFFDAGSNRTVIFMDRDRDFVVDSSDLRIELDGNVALDPSAFSAGTFRVLAGTQGADTNTSPGFTTGNDLAYAFGGDDTLDGLDGHDVINGDTGNDVLAGGLGNDMLFGGAGNDSLTGSTGTDDLNGGTGSDTLYGGDDGDTLRAEGALDSLGNVGNPATDAPGTMNWLYGGAGNDALYGSSGNDRLFGEADNDYLGGGFGDDSLEGGDGNDNLNGDDGLDTLIAGIGDDSLNGGVGSDVLVAGSGNDWVYVGPGDTVDGGDGDDIFQFDDSQAGGGIVTGGLGADLFRFCSYGSIQYLGFSTVGNPSRITDFNAAEGDRIVTGITNGVVEFGMPIVWRGTANAAFTATVGQSLTLAGADTTDNRFVGLWTFFDAGSNRTIIFMDRDRDFVVDSTDLRIELDGNVAVDAASFSAGTFSVLAGTQGADTNTSPGLTAGNDLAYAFGGDDTLDGLDGQDVINGDAGNDLLVGGLGNDFLFGGAGDDSLAGSDGADDLNGATGADTLLGGDGNDTLRAEGYLDNLTGGTSDAAGTVNWLYGGAGGDGLYGSIGNDVLFGEADNDYLAGGFGNDSLEGGDGNDNLNGDDGFDTLIAGIGDDSLNGGLGSDVLVAGSGNDWLYVGPGDTVDGGDGNDVFHFDDSQAGGGIATGGLGADTFQFSSYGSIYYLAFSTVGNPSRITDFNQAEGDRIGTGITAGVAEFGSPVVWRGTANAAFTATVGQSLTLAGADTSDNRFLGLWTFFDAGSNRTIIFMDRDRDFVVDSSDLRIELDGNIALDASSFSAGTFRVLAGTQGADTNTSPGFTAGNDLAYAFGGDDTLDGLDGHDVINGDAGNDVLAGGLGNDFLFGGAGNDSLTGSTGADDINGGSGSDTLYGGDDADTLRGEGTIDNLGAPSVDAAGTLNVLYGGAGNDGLYGTTGNDRLFGEADNDYLAGGLGADRLDGGDGSDNLVGDDGIDTLLGGAGADTLNGGLGSDILLGGVGNDLVYVGPGDTVDGGDGDDTFHFDDSQGGGGLATGGSGADRFQFSSYGSIQYLGFSTVANPSRITDFNAAEGDRIGTGITAGAAEFSIPVVWRGTANAGFTATVGQSVALAGANPADTGHLEMWTYYDAALNRTVIYMDRDRDFVVDSTDLRIELTGNVALDAASFTAGTFLAVAGTDGGDGAGALPGTINADLLLGLGGNDTIDGLAGNDQLIGGRGDDSVTGGAGNDQLLGSDGNDVVSGGNDSDALHGGTGNDTLHGGLGADDIYAAGSGNFAYDQRNDVTTATNALYGDDGNDSLHGSHGADLIDGGGDNDYAWGDEGADTLHGGGNDDYLFGGNGNDSLDGDAGIDSLYGEAGDDRIAYDVTDGWVDAGGGNDTLVLRTGETVDLGNVADQVVGGATATGFENVDAAQAIAAITASGDAGANLLIGSNFNDTLAGAAGDDTLNGGAGIDSMSGGDGNDSYILNSGADVVVETNADALTGGVDLVTTTFVGNYVLGANVENARTTSAGNASLFGNASNNVLYAGAGANTLNGGAGSDTASYLYATAAVNVNLALATAQATGGSGSDTLASIENLDGSHYADTLTGNAAANRLNGGLGNDTLNGAAGNDTLDGGGGNDTYYVDSAGDVVAEVDATASGGVDFVFSTAASFAMGNGIENLRITTAATSNVFGNTLDNLVYAGNGNNAINAGAGNDTVSYLYATGGITATLALLTAQATGGSGSDSFANVENLTGSNHGDNLTGNGLANVLQGVAGDDTLNGGAGADTLLGGGGSDTYFVDNAGDVVSETVAGVAGGIDTVVTGLASYTLGANLEHLRLTNAGATSATGNTLANTIWAATGDNVLDGGAGTDTLSYFYATGGITVNLALTAAQATGGSGTDTLVNFENLTGSQYADELRGNALANAIDGGNSADWLLAGGGADVLTGGAGADLFVYSAVGESTLAVRDTITDFDHAQNDRIDLSRIDANATLAGNQAFAFIGGAAFSANATGQVRYEAGVLYASTDADADAEFAITLTGSPALVAADLLL